MKQKIKNKRYRNFLDNGLIDFVMEEDINKAINNVNGKNIKSGRALIICMYFTGARPIEVLNLKAKDVILEKSYIKIRIPASKNGLPRTLFFQHKNPLIKELYKYATTVYDDMYLFYNFRSYYKRILPNGKERIEITDTLRYYFNKWFDEEINPYFLRHNRFSKLSEKGLNMTDIKFMKGSRTLTSVEPYLHLSTSKAKKIAKKID